MLGLTQRSAGANGSRLMRRWHHRLAPTHLPLLQLMQVASEPAPSSADLDSRPVDIDRMDHLLQVTLKVDKTI
jgi:hypothetical protein